MAKKPTPSELFYARLLEEMRGNPISGHPERTQVIVPEQTAAAWFYNNLASRPRCVCVVECGPNDEDIRIFQNETPNSTTRKLREMPRPTPPRGLRAVAMFVKLYVLGD